MDLQLRALGPDDLDAVITTDETAFSERLTSHDREQLAATVEWPRAFGAFDGDLLCGTAAAFAMELTVPGLAVLPTSGVTGVGVLPTHRRQGVLTQLMRRQLTDVAERGEPLAVLTASEATIYGRFGYGVATSYCKVEVAKDRAALVDGGGGDEVTLRLLSAKEAEAVVPAWFDAFRRSWPGQISRPEAWWPFAFGEHETWRGGGAQFVVGAETADGRSGGYAIYRRTKDAASGEARLDVRELVAADPDVAGALWRFLFEVDLVDTIEAEIGVDDPLRWRLVDCRALTVLRQPDLLWARILDPVATLSARTYETEAELVVELADAFWPDAAGRFLVAGGPGGAEVSRTRRRADVALDVSALGSLYLGGVSARALGQAGRIEERTTGAVEVADRMFVSRSTRPHCSTAF